MTDQHEENINWLNKLIDVCKDGNRGYKNAAEHINDEELKTILYRLSQQRALFEAELENEVRNLGGDIEHHPTPIGSLHRKWIDFKSAFTSQNTDAVLKECKTGDAAAVEVYEEALKASIPEFIKEKVKEQHTLIKGTLIQLDEFAKHNSDLQK